MAVKIKLSRFGKIRNPQYRIAVADARNRRDGRVHRGHRPVPPEGRAQPDRDRLRARAVLARCRRPAHRAGPALLKITGDWQKFKGLPGTEGTLKVKEPKPSKLDLFNAALAAADDAAAARGHHAKKKKAPPRRPRAETAEAAAEAAAAPRRRRRMSTVVVDAVEHLVRGIVDNPDDVRVDLVTNRRGRTVEVHVHPEDLGKVIGRGGRTATALRTLVAGIGGRGIRVDVVDTDQ